MWWIGVDAVFGVFLIIKTDKLVLPKAKNNESVSIFVESMECMFCKTLARLKFYIDLQNNIKKI